MIDANIHVMPKWVIITADNCDWCTKAKELLTSKGHRFHEEDARAEGKRDWFRSMGFKTVPQIFHDGVHIGGYQSLVNYLDNPDYLNGVPAVIGTGGASGSPMVAYND